MSNKDKGIAAAAILAVVVAVVFIVRMLNADQPRVVKHVDNPPGFSEKAQAMKRLQSTGVDDSPSDHIQLKRTR